VPPQRKIDGHDITALLQGTAGVASPHEAFFYYSQNDLEAVRCGRWKLHVSKSGEPVHELYDLVEDKGETRNVIATHAEIVTALEKHLQSCREELGDARLGMSGTGCRPAGYVQSPQPLTAYYVNHPYINEMYDLSDSG
jgi:arylsulfatase A-like enzyme